MGHDPSGVGSRPTSPDKGQKEKRPEKDKKTAATPWWVTTPVGWGHDPPVQTKARLVFFKNEGETCLKFKKKRICASSGRVPVLLERNAVCVLFFVLFFFGFLLPNVTATLAEERKKRTMYRKDQTKQKCGNQRAKKKTNFFFAKMYIEDPLRIPSLICC